METMAEFGRRMQVRGTLFYLATPSALSIYGQHAEHIARMRAKAIAVGVDPATVDRIIGEVQQEASQRGLSAAWEDDQIGRRLFSAVTLFVDALSTEQRHIRHARSCDCLGHSATCCDPTCCDAEERHDG